MFPPKTKSSLVLRNKFDPGPFSMRHSEPGINLIRHTVCIGGRRHGVISGMVFLPRRRLTVWVALLRPGYASKNGPPDERRVE